MKNFAMLYGMKERLQEFRNTFYQLDPEWQKWVEEKVVVEDVFRVHNQLEDIEIFELNFGPAEIEQITRQQGE